LIWTSRCEFELALSAFGIPPSVQRQPTISIITSPSFDNSLTAHRSAFSKSRMSCADCFRGAERIDATPTGKVTTLHGLPTYVAEPSEGRSPKGVVIIIPDAFGWEFVNNRLLVDEYARSGDFTVYLPDFMNGKHFLDNFECLALSKYIKNEICNRNFRLSSVRLERFLRKQRPVV